MENKLHLGKMSGQELAQWFGIAYGSYRNAQQQKLEELKEFCEYEKVYGGVNITKIYIPTYVKNLIKKEDKLYSTMVLEAKDHLTSLSGITRKLIATYPEYKDIVYSTLYNRLRKAGIRGYGEILDNEAVGVYGRRKPVWAIKVSELNEYRFMTAGERGIYYDIIKKNPNLIENFERAAWIGEAYMSGEIGAEEIKKELSDFSNNFYFQVIIPFKERTGLQLVRATEHEEIDYLLRAEAK